MTSTRRDETPNAGRRPPKVLAVDDHRLFAEMLTLSLADEGFEVTSPGDLGREALLATARALRPDVVLLDLDLGRSGTGLPLVQPLVELGARVLAVTAVDDPAVLGEVLEAGASTVLDKTAPLEELVREVREAARPASLAAAAARHTLMHDLNAARAERRSRLAAFDRLSPREAQVLALLMEGLTADDIAAARAVAITTVRAQIRTLLTKLGVSSQRAVVVSARQAGWEPSHASLDGASVS